MARYRCDEKCWHGRTLWKRGDIAHFEEGEYPMDKKGKNIRHFTALDSPAASEKAPEPSSVSGIEVVVNKKKRQV